MPQIWLTGDCTEEHWWRGFDSETIQQKKMSIYYAWSREELSSKILENKNLGILFKLIIFSNQSYDYNHTLIITFKH